MIKLNKSNNNKTNTNKGENEMSVNIFVVGREKAFGEYKCDGKNQVMCELSGDKEIQTVIESVNEISYLNKSVYLKWDENGNEACSYLIDDTETAKGIMFNENERIRYNIRIKDLINSLKYKRNIKEFKEELVKLPTDNEMYYYIVID